MKAIVLIICFSFTLGVFSQSSKNHKIRAKNSKPKSVVLESEVVQDSARVSQSVFFQLNDTIGKAVNLEIPALTISKDLSVYSESTKKKNKKKSKANNSWFQDQFHQQMFQQQVHQQNQHMQQQIMQAQQNMMRIP